MNKRYFLNTVFIAAALVSMAQAPSCTAPMNATGTYSGKWTMPITENDVVVGSVDCPLEMTLTQNISMQPPDNLKVTGTVHVDFSCLAEVPTWPAWATIPEPSDVPVSGLMEQSGKLTLLSGGCGPGTCVILSIAGSGAADAAQNGQVPAMTGYSGEWGFAIGVAFLGNAGGKGTFEVTKVE